MTEDDAWELLEVRQARTLETRVCLEAWIASGQWIEAHRAQLDDVTLRQAFEAGYRAAMLPHRGGA